MGMTEWMSTAPPWLLDAMHAASKWSGIAWRKATSDDGQFGKDGRRRYPELRGAEAWGSCVDRGDEGDARPLRTVLGLSPREPRHVIALDLDIPAVLIPSSTPGHNHLVINQYVSWPDYKELLTLLARIGVIEKGFADASIEREETFLRLPWIRKYMEDEDARAAIEEWLGADDRPEELQSPAALEAWLATDVD